MGWHEIWSWQCVTDPLGGSGGGGGGGGGGGVGGGSSDTEERLRKIEIENWWKDHVECHQFLESAKFAGDSDVGMVTGECVFDAWHRMRLVRTFCEMLKLLNRNQRDNTIYNCLIEQWENFVIICDERSMNPRFDGRIVSLKYAEDCRIIAKYLDSEVLYNLDAGPGTGRSKRLHISIGQLHDHEGIMALMLANCYGAKSDVEQDDMIWFQVLASMLLRNDSWKKYLTCDMLKSAVEVTMKSLGITDKSVARYVRERCESGEYWAYVGRSDQPIFMIDLCSGTIAMPRRDANNNVVEVHPGIKVAEFPKSILNLLGSHDPCDFMLYDTIDDHLNEGAGYAFIRQPFAMDEV